eukprot:c27338_g1_i1.p1 GENE.c27338_g1_i1~~c27338_g1_i1.p1  ORF type:complete len:117 (-),score=44.59 c27338_g1_i1:49-399(-)
MLAVRAKSLFRKCLRIVPEYVQAPGVRDFLERELVKEIMSRGGDMVEVNKFKSKITKEMLEKAAKQDIVNSFRENTNLTNPKEIEEMIVEAETQVEQIYRNIIVGKRGFALDNNNK